MKIENKPVDFIIPWVNPNDAEWQKRKHRFESNSASNDDCSIKRYRDMDTLRYLFRSIEVNAPWVNRVYFVTCNQIPEWLNINNPKLCTVNHEEFIPTEYLPTFSSRVIEFNYHRIEGISDNIVCFNDDMFIIKKTKEEDFFYNNLPCDAPCMCFMPVSSTHFLAPLINVMAVNRHFDKKKTVRGNPLKWYNPKYGINMLRNIKLMPSGNFTGFINAHIPFSIKKQTLEELWKYENESMTAVCSHKFRNELDVNIWLTSYWQYAKNEFYPRNPGIGAYIGLSGEVSKDIGNFNNALSSKAKLLCLNDEVSSEKEFECVSEAIKKQFESLFPSKSSFELN